MLIQKTMKTCANIIYKKLYLTQTRIIQYRFEKTTGKYKKTELTLSWSDLIHRSAIDLVRVVHKSNGRTLKHGLRTKSKIIASMIIWTISCDRNPYEEECNYFFDWEDTRLKDLTDKYSIRRGETEYDELDQTIYGMLINPNASVYHISKWIAEGPDYELRLKGDTQHKTMVNQDWDKTPERNSLWSLDQPEQPFQKVKKKGLYQRMKNWIAKTIK